MGSICSASGAQHPCASGTAISGTFNSFGRGATFSLVDDKHPYALAGVFLSIPSDVPPVVGNVNVHPDGQPRDRYARLPVHVFQNQRWIQGELLARGQAVVFNPSGSAECIALLYQTEGKARTKNVGVWKDGDLLLQATELDRLSKMLGRFVVVEGRVVSVGDRSKMLYLNFGKNWAQDFTVAVVKKGANAFNGNIGRLKRLSNKWIQVRGYLEERQGPLIRLVDEKQIKLLP